MGDDYQSPITEDMDEFGKNGVESLSYNQSLTHSAYDSAESIALTRTSKTSNYVRCWLRRCKFKRVTENMILLENMVFQGNCMQWLYRREKQVHNRHKLITQDERA